MKFGLAKAKARSCIAALVVTFVVGAIPLGMASSAIAQAAPATEKVDSDLAWLNNINRRQIRQDRILGFGFGINTLLLIFLTGAFLRRSSLPGPTKSDSNPTTGFTAFASSVGDRVARLRFKTNLASIVRRQKRIERLINEMRIATLDNINTRGKIRDVLDELLEEAARISAESKEILRNAEKT